MDLTSIIGAVITGGLALVGVIISNFTSNKKIETQLQISQAVTDTKIQELSDRMSKHNNLIERVYKLEQDQAVTNEKLAVANHRISDIESKVN